VLFLVTDGTASGVPGFGGSLETEAAAQAWLLRLDRSLPDGVVLPVLAGVALLVLVVRAARLRRSERARHQPDDEPAPDSRVR
jgi:hypothetical protein